MMPAPKMRSYPSAEVEQLVIAPALSSAAVAASIRLADDQVDPVALRPAGRDSLDTVNANVHACHVGVFFAGLVEAMDHRWRVPLTGRRTQHGVCVETETNAGTLAEHAIPG